MPKYIMRLDDACEKMDIKKWNRIETLLDKYNIKPLVGVIPHCEDPMMNQYPTDNSFWEKVHRWESKGWTIALHGYNHVYSTECGGINPIHKRSEFAGEPLEVQQDKIRKGVEIFREHGIDPHSFFAPSHTFDDNTLVALKTESNIRIVSDTIAWRPYIKAEFGFVPQQCGRARWLPFSVVTFCYHPNVMTEEDYIELEKFILRNKKRFVDFNSVRFKKKVFIDVLLSKLYYLMHR